ncbi:MAG: OmpW/AlkL family protein, partial [Hyphomicrobiaceae bacterium]
MTTFKTLIASMAIGSAALAGAASTASAGDYNGDFLVRLQGTYLYTDDNMDRVTLNGADITAAFQAGTGESYTTNSVLPTLTLTYFFNKNIAAELFCCFGKSSVKLDLVGGGSAPVGDTWMFPPIVTLQYHFDSMGGFKPYVGAGVQYIHFFSEDAAAAGDRMTVDNAFGFALQA